MHEVDYFTRVAQLDRGKRFHFAHFERDQHVVGGGKGAAFTPSAGARLCKVVAAQHHVLRRNGDRSAVRGRKNVVRGKHQGRGFDLRFRRQRNVDGHLVAVEIGVESGADQRVDLDGLAFDKYGLKSLDAQAVQRGSAVEKDRMVLDHFFQNVPNHRILLLDEFLGLLDGGAMAALLEAVIDEGLEQLERHLLGKTALVETQIGADHDHGTAGIIDALTEQVLAKAALLAF